jgi:hypothetical protein
VCAYKETDVGESPNDSTPAGGEGYGSRGETFHPIYGESPVSSMAEHPLQCKHPNRNEHLNTEQQCALNVYQQQAFK